MNIVRCLNILKYHDNYTTPNQLTSKGMSEVYWAFDTAEALLTHKTQHIILSI